MAKVQREIDDEARRRILGVLLEVAERVERDERQNPPPSAACDISEHSKGPSTRPHDFMLLNFQNDQFYERRMAVAAERVASLRRRLAEVGA